MNYRNFKGEQVAEIGLGTWQLGSADWGVIDDQRALEILDSYVQAGGNFIDTADVYGMGNSERLIGQYLKQTDKKIYVATKLGRRQDGPNGWPQNFSYDAIRAHVEQSLSNLGVDQLFLEQLHCIPTEELRKGEVFDHLRKLQQEGLIKHIGVSVESEQEAHICLEHADIASLQVIFNLFRQHLAEAFFDKAAAQTTSIIARVPLASGLLSGKYKVDTKFDEKDHRNYNADGNAFNIGETFSGIEFKEGVQLANAFKSILPAGDLSTLSIRWILDHPAVTTVIPGASKKSQVESNLKATTMKSLNMDTMQALKSFYNQNIRKKIRGLV